MCKDGSAAAESSSLVELRSQERMSHSNCTAFVLRACQPRLLSTPASPGQFHLSALTSLLGIEGAPMALFLLFTSPSSCNLICSGLRNELRHIIGCDVGKEGTMSSTSKHELTSASISPPPPPSGSRILARDVSFSLSIGNLMLSMTRL